MAEWESAEARTTTDEWESPAIVNPNLRQQGINREDAHAGMEFVNRRDPGVDYRSGVPNVAFRASFSRMDNPAERERYLDKQVGKGNWGQDSFGAYFITPKGLEKFGITSRRPISVDEQLTTRYDIADWAGDLPAVIGAAGMGMAATGLGAPAGIGLTALGGAAGYATGELFKNVRGEQVKTPGEVGLGIAKEGAIAGAGEGVVRGLTPVARFAMGPGASRMTPEKKALADSAIEQGFKIRPGSVTDAPILARWEGMVRNIFGDLYAERNEKAAKEGLERLTRIAGNPASPDVAGELLASAIRQERTAFGARMSMKYAEIDQLVGGRPIVPTAPIKAEAKRILDSMPKTVVPPKELTGRSIPPDLMAVMPDQVARAGKAVGGRDALLKDILAMGDHMTVENAQRLRTMLREASESPDLVPDVAMHDARVLGKAVNDAFGEAKKSTSELVPPGKQAEAITKLQQADRLYAEGIRKFDNATVTRITKDASHSGAVDPEMVVDYLIKPDRVLRVRRVKELVAPDVWNKVRSAHAQDLMQSVVKGTDDPLVSIFDGRAFRDTLEKYGRPVLEEVHGKEWTDAAFSYASALMLAEKKMGLSGGIVAANVALHPIRNMPKLIWLRALAKLAEQPGTFKWLTEGVRLGPNTSAGVKALSRVAVQATALAGDETGSARFTVTEPQ